MGFFSRFSSKKEKPADTGTFVPGVGRLPYPAYRGNDPYAFISYAHIDNELVSREIKRFNEAGFHVWYDEGIAPGNEWTKDIAYALQNCSLFIVMITPDSVIRRNVQNEINFAVKYDKPFVAIHLKETILPPDMELQIGTLQAILKHNMSEEEYQYKFITAFERLGLKAGKPVKPAADTSAGPSSADGQEPAAAAPVPSPEAAGEVYNDSPENAKKRANGDLVRVDGYDIEHGSLMGYFGTDKNLTVPNSAAVIRSTSFQNCRLFIESVDLNRAGCILDHAFSNCPKLHTVKVPPTVNTIKMNAFYNCPNVTLYVRRDQLPEGFEEQFTGKAIVYLDEQSENISRKTEPAAPVPEARFQPAHEHKWGSYVPKGTAYIKTKDGSVHCAIANSLVFCSKWLGGYSPPAPWFFEGLQTMDDEDHNVQGELVYFCDMESVRNDGDDLIVTNIDDEEIRIKLHPEAELWFIEESEKNTPQTVKAADILNIDFDRLNTPSVRIRYRCITTKDGSFLSPEPFLLYRGPERRDSNSYVYTKNLTALSSMPTKFNRLRKITVTKNGRDGQGMFIKPTNMEMSAVTRSGEEINIVLETGTFYAMSANGMIRALPRDSLKEIDMLPFDNE